MRFLGTIVCADTRIRGTLVNRVHDQSLWEAQQRDAVLYVFGDIRLYEHHACWSPARQYREKFLPKRNENHPSSGYRQLTVLTLVYETSLLIAAIQNDENKKSFSVRGLFFHNPAHTSHWVLVSPPSRVFHLNVCVRCMHVVLYTHAVRLGPSHYVAAGLHTTGLVLPRCREFSIMTFPSACSGHDNTRTLS